MTKVSVSKAWEETTAFVSREARLLVPLALALIFLPSVLGNLAAPNGRADMSASPVAAALFFLEIVVGVVGQIAIARLALGYREPLRDVLRHAFVRLPALLGSALIVIVPLSLAFAVAVGMAQVIQAQGSTANPLLALILLAAVVVLTVALFIVVAKCLLNTAISAVERGGPIQILKRGFSLSRGQSLRLFGTALAFAVGGGIAILAVTSIVGLGVTLALGKPEAWTVAALIIAIVSGLGQAVLSTLFTICFARLYAQRALETGAPSSGI